MCKEDVRLGRAKDYDQSVTQITAGTSAKVLDGRVKRAGVLVCPNIGAWGAAGTTFAVGYVDGSTFVCLAILSAGRPSMLLSTDEYGPVLYNPIWVWNQTATDTSVHVHDLFYDQPLEDV